MLENVTDYIQPITLEDTIQLMNAKSNWRLLAGGTVVSKMSETRTETIIDISKIGLNEIKEENNALVLGALVTISDIAFDPITNSFAGGVLAKCAKTFSHRIIRNMATVGGNIMAPYHWCDFPPVLVALDAQLHFQGKEKKVVSAEDFFNNHKRSDYENYVLTEIHIPQTSAHFGIAFKKVAKTTGDIATVNVCVSAEKSANTLSNVKIVIGAAKAHIFRLTQAEQQLNGAIISTETIDAAINAELSDMKLLSNIRADSDYRKTLISVYVRRLLESLVSGGDI